MYKITATSRVPREKQCYENAKTFKFTCPFKTKALLEATTMTPFATIYSYPDNFRVKRVCSPSKTPLINQTNNTPRPKQSPPSAVSPSSSRPPLSTAKPTPSPPSSPNFPLAKFPPSKHPPASASPKVSQSAVSSPKAAPNQPSSSAQTLRPARASTSGRVSPRMRLSATRCRSWACWCSR